MAAAGPPDDDRWLRDHLALAHAVTRRYANHYDYDETLNDVMVAMVGARHSHQPSAGASLLGWVWTKASFAAIDGQRGRYGRSKGKHKIVVRFEGMTPDEIRQVLAQDPRPSAVPMDEDSGQVKQATAMIEHGYSEVEAAVTVPGLMAALNRREHYIIEQHFWDGRTLTDLAAELGVSPSRMAQIKGNAIERMQRISELSGTGSE